MQIWLEVKLILKAWPNAPNIVATFSTQHVDVYVPQPPGAQQSGPSVHALVLPRCVSVAKRVLHHATSQNVARKI